MAKWESSQGGQQIRGIKQKLSAMALAHHDHQVHPLRSVLTHKVKQNINNETLKLKQKNTVLEQECRVFFLAKEFTKRDSITNTCQAHLLHQRWKVDELIWCIQWLSLYGEHLEKWMTVDGKNTALKLSTLINLLSYPNKHPATGYHSTMLGNTSRKCFRWTNSEKSNLTHRWNVAT